jgi:hypothetical protein
LYLQISTTTITTTMVSNKFWLLIAGTVQFLHFTTLAVDCDILPRRLHISDGPYENYLYSDRHSTSHVIVTSPLPSSNLSVIYPRLIVAWPAGNSGILAVFAPQNGQTGTLAVYLEYPPVGDTIEPIYVEGNPNPEVGVAGFINFNSSAILKTPVLGSIRFIRAYTEGRSIIDFYQAANQFTEVEGGGAAIARTWLDDSTVSWLIFRPVNDAAPIIINREDKPTLQFGAGTYYFTASFNYPQLEPLRPEQVLNQASAGLIEAYPDETTSLSFFSTTQKLTAGTWRFLTYFGRDSMISLLLLQPVLSEGQGGAIETIIGAVLERVNKSDGSACHEEIIGDFATYMNLIDKNLKSNTPSCDYKMVDTDYFLPIVMKNYLVDTDTGRARLFDFMETNASFLADNNGLKYAQLAQKTMEKIMKTSAPFAAPCGQRKENLIHLKDGENVGQWRDSSDGLGGGRIPYDVNTALVPAALRAIAALCRAGLFSGHPEWPSMADQFASVWEESTLQFFEVSIPKDDAVALVKNYVSTSKFPGPDQTDTITSDMKFYGLALDGGNDRCIVRVMNTDDCFRHFLLDTTNQTQLSSFLGQTADHILQPFPAGLSSPLGLFVANPAFGDHPSYARDFTRADYHGTVVWSWQLAMMGAGLARQLARCKMDESSRTGCQIPLMSQIILTDKIVPDFCTDTDLYLKIRQAYTRLWDLIDDNRDQLGSEVWSWTYDEGFLAEPLGTLTATESDIRQLWSLTFLAVTRQEFKDF